MLDRWAIAFLILIRIIPAVISLTKMCKNRPAERLDPVQWMPAQALCRPGDREVSAATAPEAMSHSLCQPLPATPPSTTSMNMWGLVIVRKWTHNLDRIQTCEIDHDLLPHEARNHSKYVSSDMQATIITLNVKTRKPIANTRTSTHALT